MKDQVLSISQMKHLKDLGMNTDKASMCWLGNPNSSNNYDVFIFDEYCYEISCFDPIPAFTLQDLLSIIPSKICSKSHEIFSLRIEKYTDEWEMYYRTIEDNDESKLFTPIYGDTLLEATYGMLCYLAENKLLEKEEKK